MQPDVGLSSVLMTSFDGEQRPLINSRQYNETNNENVIDTLIRYSLEYYSLRFTNILFIVLMHETLASYQSVCRIIMYITIEAYAVCKLIDWLVSAAKSVRKLQNGCWAYYVHCVMHSASAPSLFLHCSSVSLCGFIVELTLKISIPLYYIDTVR